MTMTRGNAEISMQLSLPCGLECWINWKCISITVKDSGLELVLLSAQLVQHKMTRQVTYDKFDEKENASALYICWLCICSPYKSAPI